MMAASDPKELNLLLVGRTGNGKSSTLNSILCEDVFSEININDPVAARVAQVDGRTINVVDGTSIGDTVEDISGGIEALSVAVHSVTRYLQSIFGFHAILFVLKYGVRFTKQEKDAVHCVKSMFGEDAFKRWGVIVMTYGDNFEKDEAQNRTFEEWCKSQSGDFKSLYDECDYRCVLFNNRANSSEQRGKLTSLVDRLKAAYTEKEFNRPYCILTREIFLLSQEVQEKLTSPQGLNKQEHEVLLKKFEYFKVDVSKAELSNEEINELMKKIPGLERSVVAADPKLKKNHGEKLSLINKQIPSCSGSVKNIVFITAGVLFIGSLTIITVMKVFSYNNDIAIAVPSTVLVVTFLIVLVYAVKKIKAHVTLEKIENGY